MSPAAVPVNNESDTEEFNGEDSYTIRSKWLMDGAKTLEEAQDKLRDAIEWLQSLKDEGWELVSEVDDDYGDCRKGGE